MSLTEAIKQKASQHQEQINKALLASTYVGDLLFGASGTAHPYKEAWLGPLKRLAQNVGHEAIESVASIAEIGELATVHTLPVRQEPERIVA